VARDRIKSEPTGHTLGQHLVKYLCPTPKHQGPGWNPRHSFGIRRVLSASKEQPDGEGVDGKPDLTVFAVRCLDIHSNTANEVCGNQSSGRGPKTVAGEQQNGSESQIPKFWSSGGDIWLACKCSTVLDLPYARQPLQS